MDDLVVLNLFWSEWHKLTSIGFCMLSFSTIQQILNRQADNDPDMGDDPEF